MEKRKEQNKTAARKFREKEKKEKAQLHQVANYTQYNHVLVTWKWTRSNFEFINNFVSNKINGCFNKFYFSIKHLLFNWK